MNILHVSSVKNWGGGEKNIEDLCEEFPKYYPEVNNIILCIKNGLFHKRLQKSNLKFETASLAFKMDLRFSIKIIQLCKKHKIDIIHIHDPSAIQLCILADKLYDLPPFIFNKKTSFPIKNRKSTLYKYNYPKIKKYFCVSKETEKITAESILDKSKLITIYNGINIDKMTTTADFSLKEKFNISPDKKIIGIIGNHIRAKNLETLIDVIDIVVNKLKIQNLHFIQIGNFTDRTIDLKNKVEELNLNSYINFTGYVENASAFIPQFDVLLMTSQSEGLPLVIYESFFYKVPVISTDVGGIPEAIEHKVNGLLAPKHNPEALANLILAFFRNPEDSEKYTNLSYKKLIEKFTTKTMIIESYNQYKKIISDNLL